jgi:hypothetical protein
LGNNRDGVLTINTDNLNWVKFSATNTNAAGSNQQVQFNNSGSFGASPTFKYDSSNTTLSITGSSSISPIGYYVKNNGGGISSLILDSNNNNSLSVYRFGSTFPISGLIYGANDVWINNSTGKTVFQNANTSSYSFYLNNSSSNTIVPQFNIQNGSINTNVKLNTRLISNISPINIASGSTNPTTSLKGGDLYFNSTGNTLRFYNGSIWNNLAIGGSAIYTSNNGISLSLGGNLTGATTIGLGSNDLTFTGTTATLKYGSDLSSNYTLRSIPDVNYVTGLTSNSGNLNIVIVSSNTTISNSVGLVLVNTSTSGITITLPASPIDGKILRIKDKSGNAFNRNILINGNTRVIDGNSTALINSNYGGLELVYSLTDNAWYVISFIF